MPKGYNGKILRVDLTTGHIQVEEPSEVVCRTYFGGEVCPPITCSKS